MDTPLITLVYSHGRNGSPWFGAKILALRPIALRFGINIIAVKYNESSTLEEMEELLFKTVINEVNVPQNLIFLGSSRGAYISTRVSRQVANYFNIEGPRYIDDMVFPSRRVLGLFLIAPAFYINPNIYSDQNPTPAKDAITKIVHGYDDEVISYTNSLKFAQKHKAELILIDGDHRLNTQIENISAHFETFLMSCIKADSISQ